MQIPLPRRTVSGRVAFVPFPAPWTVLLQGTQPFWELMVQGTREGLDDARGRGVRLGRPQAMTAEIAFAAGLQHAAGA